MKKTTLILLLFCTSYIVKSQDLDKRLINIHNVPDLVAMNAISNPNERSFVFVESEKLTYQYINGSWVSSESFQNTVDSLITAVTALAAVATGDSCCGVNTSSPEVLVKIGDTIGCGVVFYISPDWEFALICSFDHVITPFGCSGQDVGTSSGTPPYDGRVATNALIAAGCDIGTTVDNYSTGGNCDDWYVGSEAEMSELFFGTQINNVEPNFVLVNQTLSDLGFPLLSNDIFYWLPIELNQNDAWCFQLNSSGQFFSNNIGKNIQRRLRPIRRHFF